jgi:hypothetical protein
MVWSTDRQGSTSNYQATYRHVSAQLREWNVRARPFDLPADGETVFGDWKMPLSWECNSATLEIIDPFELRHKILADRKKRPESVVYFSGATPANGITSLLVRILDDAEFAAKKSQLKGKLAYVASDPRPLKMRLIEAGAVGVISSWSPAERYMPDATASVESWADRGSDSGFHAGDAAFPAMMISPAMGVELDVLFDRGQVRVKMVIDAKTAAGVLPLTCGYIDATLQEEVVAVCSTQRAGANACASGAAVALEAMRVIQDAATSGALPPLKRALRAMLGAKGVGTQGFAIKNPGILRRAVAAINLEAIGRSVEQVGASFKRIACPDAAPSVADTLLDILIEELWHTALPYSSLERSPYAFVDNGYNDPKIAVPCPAVVGVDRLQGTSADTPTNQFSVASLKAFATLTGAYFHILSTCTQREALWLAHETVRRYGVRIENAAADCAGKLALAENAKQKPALMACAFDRMDYLKEISEKSLMSAKNFMLRDERASGHLALLRLCRHLRRLVDLEKRRLKELADCDAGTVAAPVVPAALAGVRPYKKFAGTPSYGSVPVAEQVLDGTPLPSPRDDAMLHAACFWSDGHHTFEQIVRALKHEFGRDVCESFWRHFQFMELRGLLLLLKPGEPVPKPPKAIKTADDEAPAEDAATEASGAAETSGTTEAAEGEAPVEAAVETPAEPAEPAETGTPVEAEPSEAVAQ